MTRSRIKQHDVKLKRYKSADGTFIKGLWESNIVRMEAVDGGWEVEVPMRDVGCVVGKSTTIFEFRPIDRGGYWKRVGTYRTRDHGCIVAERLQSGEFLLQEEYSTDLGIVPARLVRMPEVSDLIATRTAA